MNCYEKDLHLHIQASCCAECPFYRPTVYANEAECILKAVMDLGESVRCATYDIDNYCPFLQE